jgi:hypothetical protein
MTRELSKSNLTSTLSVAIIMDNLEEIQKLSRIFKRVGVMPYYFTSLKHFWQDCGNEKSRLILIDVELLNEENFHFKNHPHITGDMPSEVIFFYTKDSEPLLRSTLEIDSLGQLKKADQYEIPVRSLLRRFNKFETNRLQNKTSGSELHKYEYKINQLVAQLAEEKNVANVAKFEKVICFKLGEEIKRHGFYQGLGHFFQNQSWLDRFSIFELAEGGHKLISCTLDFSKSVYFPSLWLPSPVTDGLDFAGINHAAKLFNEEIFGQYITLKIHSCQEGPDCLVFLNISDADILYKTDWAHVEKFISSYYRETLLLNKKGASLGQEGELSSWEFLQSLKSEFELDVKSRFNKSQVEQKLYNLNFDRLFKTLEDHPEIDLNWQDFYRSFMSQLQKTLSHQLKFSFMGPKNVAILISLSDKVDELSKLKAFSDTFPYWKFFTNSDQILARDLRPMVRSLPVAVEAYLKFLEGKDLYSKLHQEQIKEESAFTRQLQVEL